MIAAALHLYIYSGVPFVLSARSFLSVCSFWNACQKASISGPAGPEMLDTYNCVIQTMIEGSVAWAAPPCPPVICLGIPYPLDWMHNTWIAPKELIEMVSEKVSESNHNVPNEEENLTVWLGKLGICKLIRSLNWTIPLIIDPYPTVWIIFTETFSEAFFFKSTESC